MRSVLLRGAVVAVVLLVGEAVRAADYPELPPPPQPIVEYISNWYVRVDGGYGVQTSTRASTPFSNSRITNTSTFDVGFGYKKDWFRADATVDYGPSSRFVGESAAFDLSARIMNVTTLFNAYFDLGTWWGLTPYIGAGAGFSYFRPSELSTAPQRAAANFDFAWAGNAGLAYNLSRNMLLDLSYRFLDMGTSRSSVPAIGSVSFGNITTQQVRLGLRYQID